MIVSVLIELVAFGSPDGISQLASKIYKHLFLAFIFSDDWVTSAYVSNVAYFATAVASFISIGAVFSMVVGFYLHRSLHMICLACIFVYG